MLWHTKTGTFNVLAMELLGPSLEDHFESLGRKFSLQTVLLCGLQMLDRLEQLHRAGILHRDIKPNNFLVGTDPCQIFLVDFGIAKSYVVRGTHDHIPYREGHRLVGTARYCSLNAHSGIEVSRRDDLESLAYVLIRMCRGSLPWENVQGASKQEKHQLIHHLKQSSFTDLFDCLPALGECMSICRGLSFDDRPPYQRIRDCIETALCEHGFKRDGMFDWCACSELSKCTGVLQSIDLTQPRQLE
jgi:serine/threonine protein kinase